MGIHKPLVLASLAFLMTISQPSEAASDDGVKLVPAIQTESFEGLMRFHAEPRTMALETRVEELLTLVDSLAEENAAQNATIRSLRNGLSADAQAPSSKVPLYQRSYRAACGLGSFAGGTADVGWMRNRDPSDGRRSDDGR